jgi:rRNA biogenesis protein RRP5
MVLCQIIQINPLDLVVALPNNLTGRVPITSISDTISRQLEDKMEDSESEESDDTDVDLKAMFRVGQYLRAYVASTVDESSSGHAKKRIELSIRPNDANTGLTAGDICKNSTVMASILSAEDHGYVMDLGISGMQGFLLKKEVDPAFEEDDMLEGAAFLCLVKSKNANNKVVQLSTLPAKIGNIDKSPTDAPTINTFLPGTAVSFLVVNTSDKGLVGKVMGLLDVTADLVHSGLGPLSVDLDSEYKIGSRGKARVIYNFPEADSPKLGISLLPHITSLKLQHTEAGDSKDTLLDRLPVSTVVDQCTVRKVHNDFGLFVDIGIPGVPGFVHVSKVQDGRVEALYEQSGPHREGTVHRGRVIGYNALDGLFLLSFEQHILDRSYLKLNDIPIGKGLTIVVDKFALGVDGVSGLIVHLADAEEISGFVPVIHLADVQLKHPERKFKEGMKVKARVVAVDQPRQRMLLTLKKSLVNSESVPSTSMDEVKAGMQLLAWIIKVLPHGAIVKSYGNVSGFLPVNEMSEAPIKDPKEYFHAGQVLNVHVLTVTPETQKMIVSCKDPAAFGLEKQTALKNLSAGDLISGEVTQITASEIVTELDGTRLKAILPVGHLSDASFTESRAALKKIRVGHIIPAMVFSKDEPHRLILITRKPGLIDAQKAGKLITQLGDFHVGENMTCVVEEIKDSGVQVIFPGNVKGWIPKSRIPLRHRKEKDYALYRHQSVLVKLLSVKLDTRSVVAELVEEESEPAASLALNPVDSSIVTADDITFGMVVQAVVLSVRPTQLNIRLADNIQGRVDISQVFDSLDDIPDPKDPLQGFRRNNTISGRVMGVHDARSHNFLPFSHRSTHSVLELTAKPSAITAESFKPLSYQDLKVGSSHIAYVNNIGRGILFVHLSPGVRGIVKATEASENMAKVTDLERYFPIGSAFKVRVVSVDADAKRLELSARPEGRTGSGVTWDTLKRNMVLPSTVIKVQDRNIVVRLSQSVTGPVSLSDLCDDFDEANLSKYVANEVIQVSVVDFDKAKKRIRLSTRPSRVLSSRLQVTDREITDTAQLSVGDVVRGFVKSAADSGLFIELGGNLVARTKISDLSDHYIKDWKTQFPVGKLVKGRIMSVDKETGQVDLSLRQSDQEGVVTKLTYATLKVGQIVTGVVTGVESYGAFIAVDNSNQVRGLCHKKEMADHHVDEATDLYTVGDKVKAKVTKVDPTSRKISFSLKPGDVEGDDGDEHLSENVSDDALSDIDNGSDGLSDESMPDDTVGHNSTSRGDTSDDGDAQDIEMADGAEIRKEGTATRNYDWSADAFDDSADEAESGAGKGTLLKKGPKKTGFQADVTGEVDAHGIRTSTDFERLLLDSPDSSMLWIQWMARQIQVGELFSAREIAERALKTINIREEEEKLNIWAAYLNLEMTYGTPDTLDEVFKQACQSNDDQEVYQRLSTMYIQAGKYHVSSLRVSPLKLCSG